MSKVAIQGNASGTGTFTIAAPNSNTDRTLTLPDEAGTIITSASVPTGNTPSFYARRSTDQTAVPDSTTTVIVYNTADYDTDSGFNTSTGKYTVPTGKGGKYFLSGGFRTNASGAMTRCSSLLYVNDVLKAQYNATQPTNGETSSFVTAVLDLSAGDVVHISIFQNSSSAVNAEAANGKTYFNGFRLSE